MMLYDYYSRDREPWLGIASVHARLARTLSKSQDFFERSSVKWWTSISLNSQKYQRNPQDVQDKLLSREVLFLKSILGICCRPFHNHEHCEWPWQTQHAREKGQCHLIHSWRSWNAAWRARRCGRWWIGISPPTTMIRSWRAHLWLQFPWQFASEVLLVNKMNWRCLCIFDEVAVCQFNVFLNFFWRAVIPNYQ